MAITAHGEQHMVPATSLNALDWTALVLAIIGGLNWGLVGLFDFNLVSAIFGEQTALSRIVYILVGISALYIAIMSTKFGKRRP